MGGDKLIKRRIIRSIHWAARMVGLLVFVLITAIAIGEGGQLDNLLQQPLVVKVEFFAMLVMWLGLAVAWKWEGIGSAMILGGFALFWLAEGRLPRLNLAFALLLLSGLLYFLSWCITFSKDQPQ